MTYIRYLEPSGLLYAFFTQLEKVMEIFTSVHCIKYVGKIHTVETWNRTQHTEYELWAMARTVQQIWVMSRIVSKRKRGLGCWLH